MTAARHPLRRPVRIRAAALRGGRAPGDWRRRMMRAARRPGFLRRLTAWLDPLLGAPPRLRGGPLFGRTLDALTSSRSSSARPESAPRRRGPRSEGRTGRLSSPPPPAGEERPRARKKPPRAVPDASVREPRRLARLADSVLLTRLADEAAAFETPPPQSGPGFRPSPGPATSAPASIPPDHLATRQRWFQGLAERAERALRRNPGGAVPTMPKDLLHDPAENVAAPPWTLPVPGESAADLLLENRPEGGSAEAGGAESVDAAEAPAPGGPPRESSGLTGRPARPGTSRSASEEIPTAREDPSSETEEEIAGTPPWALSVDGTRASLHLLEAWGLTGPRGQAEAEPSPMTAPGTRAATAEPPSPPDPMSPAAWIETHPGHRRNRPMSMSPDAPVGTASDVLTDAAEGRPVDAVPDGPMGAEPDVPVATPPGPGGGDPEKPLITELSGRISPWRSPWPEGLSAVRPGPSPDTVPATETDADSENELMELGAKIRRILAEEARRHGIDV